jgi:DtxR family Mn-dependent transcriptional regulator
MEPHLTKTDRAALKEIWRRVSESGGSARTGDLAGALGVSPATATATVKRLSDRGFVSHEPYRGVALTESGRRLAMAVLRRHRVVERFLADILGYDWAAADRLAPSFEHDLPQEVEDRLFEALHRPSTCPHGFPIPTMDSELPAMPPLYDLEPGDRAVVALPGSTDPEMVAFLEGLGLVPGAQVEVREKHPFGGPMVLRVDGTGGVDRTLGERVARHIRVRTLDADGGAPVMAVAAVDVTQTEAVS